MYSSVKQGWDTSKEQLIQICLPLPVDRREAMSDFLTDLSNLLQQNQVMTAMEFAVTYFRQSSQPVYEFHQYLTGVASSQNKNTSLIQFLIHAFAQWEQAFASAIPQEMFDENLFLFVLPLGVLRDFCNLYQITKDYLLYLLRSILNYSIHSPEYKRLLTIVVTFDYQFEFYASEILVPLIVNVKDHLIHLYLNQKVAMQDYLLDILDHLYENGGQRFRYILTEEFGVRQVNINKKAIKKLTVRFWNSFGNGQINRYPNLASLQDRSTLGYLIGMKYNAVPDENTMSNEAWNEAVEVRRCSSHLIDLPFVTGSRTRQCRIVSLSPGIARGKRRCHCCKLLVWEIQSTHSERIKVHLLF